MQNETDERAEIILAMKELRRQFQIMRAVMGDEAVDSALSSSDLSQRLLAQIEELREGRISPTGAEAEQRAIDEWIDQAVAASDDPALVMAHRSESEAGIKGLPQTAQLLASDAAKRAAAGLSREEWITEVLQGHKSDEAAQLGCLKYIVTLWSEGPWPWPREENTLAAGA